MRAIIGDLHGEFNVLRSLAKHNPDLTRITTVGDAGIGFPGRFDPPFDAPVPIDVVQGNHDNPALFKHPPKVWADAGWTLWRWGLDDDTLYIGGAWSIDHAHRVEAVDWWRDEELDAREQRDVLDAAKGAHDVRLVITHDAPTRALDRLAPTMRGGGGATRAFLDQVADAVTPDYWAFGHHHRPFDEAIGATLYLGLADARHTALIDDLGLLAAVTGAPAPRKGRR